MKRYIRASELLDCHKVETYKGYPIVRCLYGRVDYEPWDDGSDYHTWDESEQFSVGWDKNAPEFDTVEEAREYIDKLA